MKEELLKGLTEEQVAKIKACKSQEEILAMAKQDGIELNDEQLEAILVDVEIVVPYHVNSVVGKCIQQKNLTREEYVIIHVKAAAAA